MTVIEDIAEFGIGDYFLEVNNSVGQKWYFPYKNIRAYRSIFRPSSVAGKIAYHSLPLIKHLSPILPYFSMKKVRMRLKDNIFNGIKNTFVIKDFTFAVFCGSPGRHQKLTLMIRDGKHILGYCKISDNTDVIDIFKKEKNALKFLHEKHVGMIPKVLFCNRIDTTTGIWMYTQSTEEENKTAYPTINNVETYNYVLNIMEKCTITANYQDTEYYSAINKLKDNYSLYFDGISQTILKQSINDVETKLYKSKSHYTFAHGDFTPWNSFITTKGVFAFDFEYCKVTYPPFYDIFHFYTQSCIYDKNWNSERIFNKYMILKKRILSKYIEDKTCDFYYKCYLLGIIEFYLSRDNGILNSRLEECFKIWIGIINKIDNG